MADIKEKIKKLLALASSQNENEARAALLKARELMAKNKLSESDFEDRSRTELVHILCESIAWTSDSGKVWMVDLCKMLCDNYCCVSSWSFKKGHRTYTLTISGVCDDAELCKAVIEYAVGFIEGQIKIMRRRYSGNPRNIAVSYARGFLAGLEMAFEDQKEEHADWGLVMVKPDEVQKYEDSLGSKDVKTKKSGFDPMAYLKGQKDGKSFSPERVLEG